MWCPASGTDHQFSHYWDMEGLCHNGKHVSHGFKVSIGTLVSTACMEYLVSKDFTSMDIDKAVAQWPALWKRWRIISSENLGSNVLFANFDSWARAVHIEVSLR